MTAEEEAAVTVAGHASAGRVVNNKPSAASGKGKGAETTVKRTAATKHAGTHDSFPHAKEDGQARAGNKDSDGGTVSAAAATAAAAAAAKAAKASPSRAADSMPGGAGGKSMDIKGTAAAAAKSRTTSASSPHAGGVGPAGVVDEDMDMGTGVAAAPAVVTTAADASPAQTDDVEPGDAGGEAKHGRTSAAAATNAAATDASLWGKPP